MLSPNQRSRIFHLLTTGTNPNFLVTAPRLQRGVNGSEFKTPGKLHILRVADAKPTTPRYRWRSNEGQCGGYKRL